jgi:hypothetical protein
MKFGHSILGVGILSLVMVLQGSFPAGLTAAEQQAQQAPAEPNGPAPKIFFESTLYDFGPVAPKSSNTCEFKFENMGAAVLEINDISKTCGCTVFELEKKKYAPGEKGTIKVTYNADPSSGPRTRHLYVFSNDPANPRVELTIKAIIAEKVTYEPDKLSFMLKSKSTGEVDLKIKSLDGKPFSITKFEATSNAVTADFDSNYKAAEIVLKTRLDSQKSRAIANGRVEIGLTHPECDKITVPFSILSQLRSDPPAINILNAEPGKPVQKEIWILSNYDEDFEIGSVESRDKIVKVEKQEKMGNRYKLDLEITPPQAKSAARIATDVLTVSTKDGEKVNIACRVFYRPNQ